MNATWLVGTVVVAIVGGLVSVAVALFRFTKRSPEQREQDTAAFTAATTGLGAANTALGNTNAALERRQADTDARLDRALARIDVLEASDEAKDKTITSQAARIEVLERTLRENHIEIPAS